MSLAGTAPPANQHCLLLDRDGNLTTHTLDPIDVGWSGCQKALPVAWMIPICPTIVRLEYGRRLSGLLRDQKGQESGSLMIYLWSALTLLSNTSNA